MLACLIRVVYFNKTFLLAYKIVIFYLKASIASVVNSDWYVIERNL